MHRPDQRPRLGPCLLIGLALAYLLVILVGPMIALLIETVRLGASRIIAIFTRPDAIHAIEMSLALVGIALCVNAVVGLIGAIAIVRHRFPGRALLSALVDLPLAISPVMIGLAFLLLLGRGGWLNPVLEALHLKVIFSFPGLVIATLFVTLPFTVREIAYVMEEQGTDDEEAATILGASAWQTFWYVTLPNVRLGLAYGLLMTTARTLGEFGAVLVLGGSISGKTQTATTFIADAVEERESAGAYGMAVLLALTSIVLLLGLEWAKTRSRKVNT